jgi:hypothetical protein
VRKKQPFNLKIVKGTGSLCSIKPYRQPFDHFLPLEGGAVEKIWGRGPGFFQPAGPPMNFLRLFSDLEFGIAGAAQDKRIELLITGLLPLNRRKNAAAWKAQGIGAEFHGISRRGSPWNWSG